MPLTQAVVFAVLQGLTAIFPIGASAHFALLQKLTGWPSPSPMLPVTAQCGAVLAVMAYFWEDLWDMGVGVVKAAKGKRDPGARLALQIVVAAIPAIALGIAAGRTLDLDVTESIEWVGWFGIGGGVILFVIDRMTMTVKRVEHATYVDAILIGLCQVLALLPPMRSGGAAMTMGRLLGYERDQAVRFSMLLAILPLFAVLVKTLVESPELARPDRVELIAAAVSFVVALSSLATLMTWLKRSTFTMFAVWRIVVGTAVVVLAYGWLKLAF